MHYIYIDTKITGAIQQLIGYFVSDIFDYRDFFVYFKTYKKNTAHFSKLLAAYHIQHKGFKKISEVKMDDGSIVFYPFNAQSNCRIVSNRRLAHIFVTHGESNKVSSVKPIIRIYDYVITAGQAGIDRLVRHGIFTPYDVEHNRIIPMGDTFIGQTGLSSSTPQQHTIFYAPTWEGGIPSENYSSLAHQGLLIDVLVQAAKHYDLPYIIIKPHPNTGHRLKAYKEYVIRLAAALKVQGLIPAIYAPHLDISFFTRIRLKRQGINLIKNLSVYHAVAGFCDVSAIETQLLNEKIPYGLLCKQEHFSYLQSAGILKLYHENLICFDQPAQSNYSAPYLSPELRAYMIDNTFEQIPFYSRIKKLAELIQ
ncbi:CDP-glycerol glycerophosphotransferase [Testudinibacter sp. TR-2022]|uniref:CDP-glycerol glycerophosphotransferase n=1 Tax=Testudinibacter sp. TR-2022 TaxID=2585029 RepID=UPI00111963C8|nr:CDP-glycerol glycerophosphotransferase [Testudinibacter sp. TR-2022]TNH02788.1 CDP-glycerol glycerophosphotransferase [Pasteurellaceae bacterium Phil31]TNH04791.1 CDP-glycerol glycerophosphotransferase [Testudinibacter sp. TR-2022]TNH07585.1 CDP-glycerol glycerophosphotransferase [Testudinibacter sp. TR-2022]TNH11192.1 CDP-glycerol glycerophosphotransferase [Testudinibacter sp. TR-2022]TNH19592.1 CDP-glycerol glycerophosphotransferase [Testudinibacter sp. TR-2022]